MQTTNLGDRPIEVTSIALRTGHFLSLPPESKATVIAPGSRIDIQVDFGDLVSCDVEPASPPTVEIGIRRDGEPGPTSYVGELDPTPLDDIRERECARRDVVETVDIGFAADRTVDRDATPPTMETTIEIRRLDRDEPVTVGSLEGSVIVALQPTSSEEPLAVLGPDDDVASIPVELFVARCEPHAISQSTLTWVLSVFVTVGDAESPHKLALELDDEMRSELQSMIDDCIAALPAEN